MKVFYYFAMLCAVLVLIISTIKNDINGEIFGIGLILANGFLILDNE